MKANEKKHFLVRGTSCYSDTCISRLACDSWTAVNLSVSKQQKSKSSESLVNYTSGPDEQTNTEQVDCEGIPNTVSDSTVNDAADGEKKSLVQVIM